MTLDLGGLPDSPEWVLKHFKQYHFDGKQIKLLRYSSQVTGRTQTAQTSPWRFAQNEYGKVNIYGYKAFPMPGFWGTKIRKDYVTQEEYDAFIKSLNFFENGGLTAGGVPGLDPRELIGGYRGVRRWRAPTSFVCPRGIYTPGNIRYGRPAMFKFNSGVLWVGDL